VLSPSPRTMCPSIAVNIGSRLEKGAADADPTIDIALFHI